MINPNFKNVSENLIYIIATNILTATVVYSVSVKSNLKATDATINALIPTIDKAIEKHTTAITNAIEIKDNKFKKNDSLNIIIDQKPNSDLKVDIEENNTTEPKKKKKFLFF